MRLTPFDMKRLESYGNNLIELQVVVDLLPTLAALYFARRLRVEAEADADADTQGGSMELTVSWLSAALLLGLGLQHRTLDDVAAELQLPLSQAHTLLAKAVRWMIKNLRAIERRAIAGQVEAESTAQPAASALRPVEQSLEEELAEAGSAALAEDTATQEARAALSEDLMRDTEMSQYAIPEGEHAPDWHEAEERVRKMASDTSGKAYSSTFSVRMHRDAAEQEGSTMSKRKAQGAAPKGKKSRAK